MNLAALLLPTFRLPDAVTIVLVSSSKSSVVPDFLAGVNMIPLRPSIVVASRAD